MVSAFLRTASPLVVLLVAFLTGLAACSGNPAPSSARSASKGKAPVTINVPVPPPPPPRETKEVAKPLVVLDEGGEGGPESLAEAAVRERERRKAAKPSTLVITDENLAEHATGEVTVAAPTERPPVPAQAGDEELARDESYWRDGARQRRLRLRRAVDEVAELEEQVAGLRTRFYAEDDPYVRDGRIKPAWDRALDRLHQAREDVETHQRDLADFVSEGHRLGALAGWLREGLELEPSEQELRESGLAEETQEEPGRHRPEEPKVVGEEG